MTAASTQPYPLIATEPRNADSVISLSEADLDFLERLDARIVHLADDDSSDAGIVDLDKKFTPFMDQHSLAAMLVRPDFYLYGGVTAASELPKIIESLRASLAGYGFLKTEGEQKIEERVH